MGDYPSQNPYGEQSPWGGGQPQQGPYPPPGQGPAEPYPGFGEVHADYHRRQQEEAAAHAAAGPPPLGSVNPLRNLGNWGLPAARPGLNPQKQAMYDSTRNIMRGKVLRLVGVLVMVLFLAVGGLIRLFF